MIGRGRIFHALHGERLGDGPAPASGDTFRRNALQRADTVAGGWGYGMRPVRSSIQ
jgi:hypothetical protein